MNIDGREMALLHLQAKMKTWVIAKAQIMRGCECLKSSSDQDKIADNIKKRGMFSSLSARAEKEEF